LGFGEGNFSDIKIVPPGEKSFIFVFFFLRIFGFWARDFEGKAGLSSFFRFARRWSFQDNFFVFL